MKNILESTFAQTDENMKSVVPSHHGCTAIVCLIQGSGANRVLYSANAGDARAVLWY